MKNIQKTPFNVEHTVPFQGWNKPICKRELCWNITTNMDRCPSDVTRNQIQINALVNKPHEITHTILTYISKYTSDSTTKTEIRKHNHIKQGNPRPHDFAPSSAPWWVTLTVRPLIHVPYSPQTSCHPQNRKYITYCTVVRAGPSHGHS